MGTVNGYGVRGSLGLDGTQYFLPRGTAWRSGCGLKTWSSVEVVLSPEDLQSENISPHVTAALDSVPKAKAFFESLATFYRNPYIKWIESAMRSETRTAPSGK